MGSHLLPMDHDRWDSNAPGTRCATGMMPVAVHGSISLNRALLAAGLVDRIVVMMFPAISGRAGGAALFQDGAELDLELIESTVLDGRTHELIYAPPSC